MNLLTACATGLLLTNLFGCGAKFEDENSHSEKSAFVDTKSLEQLIQIRTQGSPTPEKYFVYITWPSVSPDKRIRIKLGQPLSEVGANQSQFSHQTSHDQLLTYSFDILNARGSLESSFSKQVRIPKDWLVTQENSNLKHSTKVKVARVYLNSSSPIITNGYDLEIDTSELISDDGRIETFPLDSRAPANTPGRHGGNIKIKADLAIGKMNVTMRGENGGDGPDGAPYSSSAQSGAAAEIGDLVCGDVYSASGTHDQFKRCRCLSIGKDGTDGLPGLKGNPGLPASNGGDAGTFQLSVKSGSDFTVDTLNLPGLAGRPGAGGPGQPGGPGGSGSNNSRDCRGRPGKDGTTGPKGDDGAIAFDGSLGLICVSIESTGRNDCYE